MRTFRLIEEYYNSPELGTVIREDTNYQLVSEQIEIFQMDKILKFPKQWEEFTEIDYTGVKFKVNGCLFTFEIIEKNFDVYVIKFDNKVIDKIKISKVNDLFKIGAYNKIIDEQPKYFIGIDPASEEDGYANFRLQFGKVAQIWPDKKPEYGVISYIVEIPRSNGHTTGKFEEIKIYSITRLSDNQVFTIGDEVGLVIGTSIFKIIGFIKDADQSLSIIFNGYPNCALKLSQIIKL